MQTAAAEVQECQHLSIAQCVRRSTDPYRAAVASFTRRQVSEKQKTFYFEDGSFLTFEITYTAVGDGNE